MKLVTTYEHKKEELLSFNEVVSGELVQVVAPNTIFDENIYLKTPGPDKILINLTKGGETFLSSTDSYFFRRLPNGTQLVIEQVARRY